MEQSFNQSVLFYAVHSTDQSFDSFAELYVPNQEPSSTVNLSVPAGSCICGRETAEKPKCIPEDSKVAEEMKLTNTCK